MVQKSTKLYEKRVKWVQNKETNLKSVQKDIINNDQEETKTHLGTVCHNKYTN